MSYIDNISQLEKVALNPGASITKVIKETGKEAIGCFPVRTPEEIIYAAGMIPVGLWGGNTRLSLADKYLQSFCCSIMRSNLEYGMKGTYRMLKAVMLPTFCDTLKCLCENWKVGVPDIDIIPIVYPQNRHIEAGYTYMLAELDRVRHEVEKIAGHEITEQNLEAAWELYEEYRQTMRDFVKVAANYPVTMNARTRHLVIKAGYFMDKKQYIEDIKAITEGLKEQSPEVFSGKKLIATGLISEPVELLDIFKENELSIAADDLAQASRQFRTVSRTEGSVFEKMAYQIVDQNGDTFFYESEKTRGSMLIDMVKENGAAGVVVFMMKFCDPEEFDYPIYKKELEDANIPILYLEVDQQMDSFEQIRTRIQSFSEMLI